MLRFDSVSKRFPDGTVALRGVTLSVPRGQFCVVLGPSGAGKSTLLRTVNGLVRASEGAVSVDGVFVEPRTLARIRPRVATIHQQFNLAPRLSVAKNVLAGALPAMSTARAILHLFPAHHRRRAIVCAGTSNKASSCRTRVDRAIGVSTTRSTGGM